MLTKIITCTRQSNALQLLLPLSSRLDDTTRRIEEMGRDRPTQRLPAQPPQPFRAACATSCRGIFSKSRAI
jgi:hypothetical protein